MGSCCYYCYYYYFKQDGQWKLLFGERFAPKGERNHRVRPTSECGTSAQPIPSAGHTRVLLWDADNEPCCQPRQDKSV
jgi:hypothetical protein